MSHRLTYTYSYAHTHTHSEELVDLVQESMLLRLHDKSPSVRSEAILALARLQTPEDVNEVDDEEEENVGSGKKKRSNRLQTITCPVTQQFVYAMEHDSSQLSPRDPFSLTLSLLFLTITILHREVRKTALEALSLHPTTTLPLVFARRRDEKPEVRATVYRVFSSKDAFRMLSTVQRVSLLRDGLKDRDSEPRQQCVRMMCEQWFALHCKRDIQKVLFVLT